MATIPEALSLAIRHHQAGRFREAEKAFRQVLQAQPDHPEALHYLGLIAYQVGRHDLAVDYIGKAIALNPQAAAYHNNIGQAYRAQGRLDEAVAHFRQALALKPDRAEFFSNLGLALKVQGRLDEAVAHYRRAIALKPDYAQAYDNLGNALNGQGKAEEAEAAYGRALALPHPDGIKIKLATVLPVILGARQDVDCVRKKFDERVTALSREKLTLTDPVREVGFVNFHLAYHGRNDRDLQVKMAQLYERACPSLLYRAPHCATPARPERTGRVRIGFISRFLFHHSVGLFARGLMAELPKEKFEKYVFCVQPVKEDRVAALVRQAVEHTVVLPDDLAAARERIAKERLDILVYLDIGMEPFTYFLAFARLAPVQCVLPGHPVTTGIRAVDYFISSEAPEPADADAHYSERLVRLPRQTSYYYRPPMPASTKTPQEFGLDEGKTIYLCPQALFKFHPEFDDIMAGILRADPDGEIVLVEGREPHWTQLLRDRFERSMPDVGARVRFLPRMNGDEFLRLLAIADVVLDTIHFGGGTTSLMALGMGSPVVTLPGGFLRGRVAYGCYTRMGLMECVADSPAQYVKTAVRLGTDAAYRKRISAEILARNAVLYENRDVVREYERFFLNAVGDVRRARNSSKSNAAR